MVCGSKYKAEISIRNALRSLWSLRIRCCKYIMSNEELKGSRSPLLRCVKAEDKKNGGSPLINDSYTEIQEEQRIHEHATT